MFCKHCGHKLENGATVCPGCGTQIDPAAFGVQNSKVQLPSHEKELQDLLETTPYDDCVWMVKVTGAQFRRMVLFILRDEAWTGHTEFYQFSKGVHIVYRKSTHELLEFCLNGKPIEDEDMIKIAIQDYHFRNFDDFLGVPLEEVSMNMKPRIVANSVNNIVEEYLATHQDLDPQIEGRLVIID